MITAQAQPTQLHNQRWLRIVAVYFVGIAMLPSIARQACSDDSPQRGDQLAAAVIDGMRSTRMPYTSGSAVYEESYVAIRGGTESTGHGRHAVKWDGDKLWARWIPDEGYNDPGVARVTIRNGDELWVKDETSGASRDSLSRALHADEVLSTAFDPRITGAYVMYRPWYTPEYVFYNPTRIEPKMMGGGEEFGYAESYYIRWNLESGSDHHFIIGRDAPYAIHCHWVYGQHYMVRSTYGPDHALPIVTEQITKNERTKSDRITTLELMSLDTQTPIPEEIFEMANLEMPIGHDMTDYETKMGMGFWDGTKLVDRRTEAFVNASAQGVFEAPEARWRSAVRSVALAITALAAITWIARRFWLTHQS